jgi:hypothetical protein
MIVRRSLARALLLHWRTTGPNSRLFLGASLIIIVMIMGLMPRALFGLDIAWPYGALAAAVGWARVGLSIRPMLVLCLIGFISDLAGMAPLGFFVMVNLITYGLHAFMIEALDTAHDPVLARLLPYVSLLAGLVTVWLVAYVLTSHAVSFLPLLGAWITTSLLYTIIQPVLDLNRRPGEYGGLD